MRVFVLTSFGGQFIDDSWEHIEGVFASYSAMVTWINKEFKHDSNLLESKTLDIIEVGCDTHFSGTFDHERDNESCWLKYQSYDIIGTHSVTTDKIAF